jgi:TonB family protein
MLAKEPADRYQSCEQLVAELQRDSVAPPGSLRARPGDAPAPPLAVIPSPPAPAATTVISGTAPPRRVAQRSPVLQQRERRSWPWAAAAAVLLAAGGGGYFYLSRSVSAEPDPGPDSLAARTAAPGGAGGADSVTPVSEGPRVDSIAGTAPAAVEDEPAPAPAAPPPVSRRDSGAIRLSGIPAGSTVQIDEANPIGAVTRVAAGSHEVAVLAPQHEFYLDTVIVEAGDTVELVPALVRIGTPACSPGPAYNASQCFDQRPQPLEAPFVAAPGGNAPARGATFWVRVGADGQTLGVRIRQSSRNRGFDRVAMAFARRLTWEPARKGGTPVEAWTQIEVRPAS